MRVDNNDMHLTALLYCFSKKFASNYLCDNVNGVRAGKQFDGMALPKEKIRLLQEFIGFVWKPIILLLPGNYCC